MTDLHVSRDFTLPAQFVTHRNALLGMSGSGKSNATTVIAEELFRLRLPWILIDPKGDAFGIRSNRAGTGPGLDVPIFGGMHGDLPLAPRAGKLMGELVAADKITGIFDLSSFDSDAEKARFMADFGRALFRNRKTPIHVFCDECHEYMPQPGAGGRLEGPAAECVGVWKKVAVQGRQKGIGFTLASQRSAHVNKTCLYTCETLIAMRTMGKHDRKAIEDWADSMGEAKELRAALPQLADGEAYIFSPHRLRISKRVRFRRRETYDSGRTPEVGETVVAPKLADLDLAALRNELAALELPVAADGDGADLLLEKNAELRARVQELEAQCTSLQHAYDAACDLMRAEIDRVIQEAYAAARRSAPVATVDVSPSPARAVVHRDPKPAKSNGNAAAELSPPSPVPARSAKAPDSMGKCERALVAALKQHRTLSLSQAAIVAGYSPAASTTSVAAAKLRRLGLIAAAGGGKVQLTPAGQALAHDIPELPSGKALAEYWFGQLGKCERELLQRIVAAFPRTRDLHAVATEAGYSTTASTISVAVSKLRKLDLVTGPSTALVANPLLTSKGAR
jgi:hypothetical protein